MACYKISPKANEDIGRIWFFGLGQFSLAQADKYYYALIEHFSELAENPLAFPAVDHIRHGYRRSVFRSHSVYYRIGLDCVEIMRIIGKEDF